MATLETKTLGKIRQEIARQTIPQTVTKQTLNLAAQAVEDLLELQSTKTAVSNAIDTATSPITLSGAVKKLIVAYVFEDKYLRDK